CDVIKDGLSGVINTPWLHLVRELYLVDLGGLRRRRWRRRRSLDRSSGFARAGETAIISRRACDGDWTGLRTLRAQLSGWTGTADSSRARLVRVSELTVVRALCLGSDRNRVARLHGGRIRRASDCRSTGLLYSKGRRAVCSSLLAVSSMA